MIRTGTRIALDVVLGVVAVTALLFGLAFWRLSAGPVDLEFLTPRIEEALSKSGDGLRVRIGATQLTWGGWKRTVNLHVRDVRIRDADGVQMAAVPDVVIRLSVRALVQGTIAPTLVEVMGARVTLVRRPDGTFQFGPWDDDADATTETDAGEGDLSRVVPAVIEDLLSEPTPAEPLSFLKTVRILGGKVAVIDRKLGANWRAPFADIELRRDGAGLTGEVVLKIELGDREASLSAVLDYAKTTGRLGVTARFADLVPDAIVALAPGLTALKGLTMPLEGSVSASLMRDGRVRDVRFDITGEAGQFAAAEMFEVPLPVRAVHAAGSVDPQEGRVEIEEATVDLGTPGESGPRLTLSGTVSGLAEGFAGDPTGEAQVTIADMPMDRLGQYWPRAANGNARAWILKNVPRGWVRRARARATFTARGGKLSGAVLDSLAGTLDYEDLAVHFMRPLPPITGISGPAKFDAQAITFLPTGGRLGTLDIQSSTITITGLDAPDQDIDIDVAVVGPLRDALELLDHDRLKLVRQLGLDPSAMAGQAAARVAFRFPLIQALDVDHIEIAARANLAGVEMRDALLGQDVTQGTLALDLNMAGMRLSGPLRLGGVPLDVEWSESFAADQAERTRIVARAGRLGTAEQKIFGLDLVPYLEGPVSATIAYVDTRDGGRTIETAVNLQQAALEIAPLSWRKPPGVPGSAFVTLELAGDRLDKISSLELEAGDLRARGTATFDSKGRALSGLDLASLAFGGSDLLGVSVDFANNGVGVQIGAGSLDATPWFGGASEDAPTRQEAVAYTPLRLQAQGLDAVFFGPDRYFEDVNLDLVRSPRGWERFALDGQVPKALWRSAKGRPPSAAGADPPDPDGGRKSLRLNFGPDEGGGKRLLVTAEDMGAVLRALDALDTVNGGRLEIVGKADGPMPAGPLRARIEASDYIVVDAPVLARLLTVASLSGINDLLNGTGIKFQRLVGEFTLQNGKLETDLIRTYGPALGLTAKGTIDFDRAQTDLKGTVVPAYTVNRILGAIPLLGPLLTGGEGEGLIAVTYGMTGPLLDPEVKVNPLSALAPGFLRSLFSAGGGDEGQARALPERNEP